MPPIDGPIGIGEAGAAGAWLGVGIGISPMGDAGGPAGSLCLADSGLDSLAVDFFAAGFFFAVAFFLAAGFAGIGMIMPGMFI